jgi:hypothetical protein
MSQVSRTLRLIAACTSTAALLAACDGAGPPAAPSDGAARLAAIVQMRGKVIDGNDDAVSGARVSVVFDGGQVETVSDLTGAYGLTIPPFHSRLYATVERSGYEESAISVTGATHDFTKDLRLHRILRVNPGQPVELVRRWDDPICGYILGDDVYELPCRRVRIVSEFAGELRVDPIDMFDNVAAHRVRLQLPGRLEEPREFLRLAVGAGSETVVDVLFLTGATDTALNTSLVR